VSSRGKYKTRQRELVALCLEQYADTYMTVDRVVATIEASGEKVGRTTAYRALESMAAEGAALKACVPGGEASYRLSNGSAAGQLVCLDCGLATTLDCKTAEGFAHHVLDHHGFEVDLARTVFYGRCGRCRESADGR